MNFMNDGGKKKNKISGTMAAILFACTKDY